jgi:hypothetical protein
VYPQPRSVAQASTPVCSFPFDATVWQRADTEFTLSGQFDLPLTASGSYAGVWAEAGGAEIIVPGHVSGRSLTVLLDLGQGQYMSGPPASDGGSWSYADCSSAPMLFFGPLRPGTQPKLTQ